MCSGSLERIFTKKESLSISTQIATVLFNDSRDAIFENDAELAKLIDFKLKEWMKL